MKKHLLNSLTATNRLANMSMPYMGLWKRTALYEPKEDPLLKEENVDVHWIQSKSGLYIDLRIPKPNEKGTCSQLKSFAGYSEFDSVSCKLRWNRVIDYRGIPAEDVGIISNIGANIIQEDSALDGDDYREIWERVDDPKKETEDIDNACILFDMNVIDKKPIGYYVQVNNSFSLTLNLRNMASSSSPSLDDLREYFCGSLSAQTGSSGLEAYLKQYITMFGSVDDWKIALSLDAKHINDSIERVEISQEGKRIPLLRLLHEYEWETVSGSLPTFLKK